MSAPAVPSKYVSVHIGHLMTVRTVRFDVNANLTPPELTVHYSIMSNKTRAVKMVESKITATSDSLTDEETAWANAWSREGNNIITFIQAELVKPAPGGIFKTLPP